MNIDNQKILSFVSLALDKLYKKEKKLFECNASERNLVFHFGRYLIDILNREGFDFNTFSLDFEYNRDKDAYNEIKYKEIIFENKRQRIIPDLLLHKRGSNDSNILAVEFKKRYNKNASNDKYKLRALTDNEYKFKYQMGLLIIFNDGNNYSIYKFINGNEVD